MEFGNAGAPVSALPRQSLPHIKRWTGCLSKMPSRRDRWRSVASTSSSAVAGSQRHERLGSILDGRVWQGGFPFRRSRSSLAAGVAGGPGVGGAPGGGSSRGGRKAAGHHGKVPELPRRPGDEVGRRQVAGGVGRALRALGAPQARLRRLPRRRTRGQAPAQPLGAGQAGGVPGLPRGRIQGHRRQHPRPPRQRRAGHQGLQRLPRQPAHGLQER